MFFPTQTNLSSVGLQAMSYNGDNPIFYSKIGDVFPIPYTLTQWSLLMSMHATFEELLSHAMHFTPFDPEGSSHWAFIFILLVSQPKIVGLDPI